MITREQENTIERLAEVHGRVYVRHGYTDKAVRLTAESGAHFIIPEHGVPTDAGTDFSVDWSVSA